MSEQGDGEMSRSEGGGPRGRQVLDYRGLRPNRRERDYRRLTLVLTGVFGVLLLAPLGGRAAIGLTEPLFWTAGVLSLVVLGFAITTVLERQGRLIILLGIACPAAWVGAQYLYFSLGLGGMHAAAESSYHVKCASELRQIAQGILLYSQRHSGAYPPSLAAMYVDDPQSINPAIFVCPGSSARLATGGTSQQVAAQLAGSGCISYTYLGQALTSTAGPDDVVAFDAADQHHCGDGINVLCGDGHVEFVIKAVAKALINQAKSGVRPVGFPPPAVPTTIPQGGA